VPPGTTLSPLHYAQLIALFDAVLPAGDVLSGATRANAAWYLDQLLCAFRTSPPRIYAGGPYSGRHGGVDGFSQFQPLTRVEEIRWRTYLEGSQGLPAREFNGPVKGLRQTYEENLDALDVAGKLVNPKGFAFLSITDRGTVIDAADQTFIQLAYEQAVEGTYGDPVYGGNFEEAGWKGISYEGDRQPIGYTASQMMNPGEGA